MLLRRVRNRPSPAAEPLPGQPLAIDVHTRCLGWVRSRPSRVFASVVSRPPKCPATATDAGRALYAVTLRRVVRSHLRPEAHHVVCCLLHTTQPDSDTRSRHGRPARRPAKPANERRALAVPKPRFSCVHHGDIEGVRAGLRRRRLGTIVDDDHLEELPRVGLALERCRGSQCGQRLVARHDDAHRQRRRECIRRHHVGLADRAYREERNPA